MQKRNINNENKHPPAVTFEHSKKLFLSLVEELDLPFLRSHHQELPILPKPSAVGIALKSRDGAPNLCCLLVVHIYLCFGESQALEWNIKQGLKMHVHVHMVFLIKRKILEKKQETNNNDSKIHIEYSVSACESRKSNFVFIYQKMGKFLVQSYKYIHSFVSGYIKMYTFFVWFFYSLFPY